MKKNLIVWGLGIVILIIWLVLWDVQIQMGIASPQVSTKTIHTQLSKLQNINWSFFRSPGESLAKELASFWATQHTLDLRTYEFTQKDFKTTLKKLAASGVHIRIIIEDNKFQQFQNTLKVLSQYYSWYKNIQLKSDKQMGTEYVHAKVNLLDSGFIIQTANLTQSSFTSNREHFFQSFDTWILASLRTIFEKDWKGEKIKVNAKSNSDLLPKFCS